MILTYFFSKIALLAPITTVKRFILVNDLQDSLSTEFKSIIWTESPCYCVVVTEAEATFLRLENYIKIYETHVTHELKTYLSVTSLPEAQ